MFLLGSEEGNTTTTLVKIMVKDVNDMAPEFTSVPTGKLRLILEKLLYNL